MVIFLIVEMVSTIVGNGDFLKSVSLKTLFVENFMFNEKMYHLSSTVEVPVGFEVT